MRFSSRSLALWASSAVLIPRFAVAFAPYRKFALKTRREMTSSADDDQTVRIALCQFKVTNDKEKNHKVAGEYIQKAHEKGSQLVMLPEIWNSPYATSAFADYAEVLPSVGHKEAPQAPSIQLLIDKAKECNFFIVGGSIPELDGENIYNTCLVISPDGEVLARHRKVHLFDISVPGGITFRESDTLSAGDDVTFFDGGSLLGTVGVGICYDIRFPEYAQLLAEKFGCQLLLYPGAFNLTTGPAHWELLQRARAVDNQCYVAMASPARTLEEDAPPSKYPHYTAWGHSTVVAPWGNVLATTDEHESLVVADLDMKKVQEMRQSIPCFEQKRHDLYELKGAN